MPEEYIQKEGYQLHTMWNDIDFGGSALVGTLDGVEFYEIVKYLGQPMYVNGAMIENRWLLKFDDGIVATIFNYKGEKELRVGGFREVSKERLLEQLDKWRSNE